MPLKPQPAYRAVVLQRFHPDAPDNWIRDGIQTYTDAAGTDYQYHKANAYGPYSTPGAAQASATRESNDLKLYRWGADFIAGIDAFVEETSAVWSLRKK